MVRRRFVRSAVHLIALMLVVVTIEAEQFPVAAVGGIIVMVVILVMDREVAQFLALKFAPAVGANPGE
jgi:MFS superfamily sulfate permease-like transporter